MTDPDFRALCAQAAEHLSLLDDPPHQLVIALQEALAQPAPEPQKAEPHCLSITISAPASFWPLIGGPRLT